MDTFASVRRRRESRVVSLPTCVAVILLAAAALAGWWLEVPVLQSAVPGLIAMNPATAVTFLLAAASLLAFRAPRRSRGWTILSRTLAVMVVLVAVLCMSRHFLPWDLGVDRLLFPGEVSVPLLGFPNRMAPVTAANFALIGIALFLIGATSKRVRRIALLLATLAGFSGLVVLVDYGFASSLATVNGSIPVALNTAIAFVLLAIAIQCARPTDGLASLFLSSNRGGDIARRLLPIAFIVPLFVGWAELRGRERNWFDRSGGASILAIVTTLMLTWLIWRSARWIDRADRARNLAEGRLHDLNRSLEARVIERTRALEETEEAVRRGADELRSWFDASPLAACRVTPDRVVVSWNRAAEALFGWTAAEVVGQFLPVVSDDMLDEHQQLAAQVLSGRPLVNHETRRRHKDGQLIDVSVSTAPLHDANGTLNGLAVVYADIRERKRLEAQLQQAQKMEAVGRLAGGVAHDFNNILMVIQATSGFLLEDLDPGDRRRADVEQIADAGQRAAALTRQLLSFSRQQVLELRALDVNASVASLEPLMRRLLEANIELLVRLTPGIGHVKADAGQLDQVLMNLIVNARDAMPDGGSIVIETSRVVLDPEFPRAHLAAKPGPHVLLSLTDTGTGMDAATQSRIFEPFFTTKPAGQGTGLGLSVVYGIVQQLGGDIWVYSEVGRGTTFKIYLPISGADSAEPVPVPVVRRGDGTDTVEILLVEDNPATRATIRRLLERRGYHIQEASNGIEALAVLAAAGSDIDMVLSDMVMTGMGGLELRRRLAELPAAPPLLLMSGYSEQALTRLETAAAEGPVIQKPFTGDQIAQRIEGMLAGVVVN